MGSEMCIRDRLLIVRGQDDVVRAFYNVCVHRGHILAEGSGTANKFVCPYHAWTYQTDGTLRAAPGAKVSSMPDCTRSLRQIETRIRDGFVFVRLEEGKDDFDEKFGGFFDELNRTIPDLSRMRFVRRYNCLLYTSPSPRDLSTSRMPSSA